MRLVQGIERLINTLLIDQLSVFLTDLLKSANKNAINQPFNGALYEKPYQIFRRHFAYFRFEDQPRTNCQSGHSNPQGGFVDQSGSRRGN